MIDDVRRALSSNHPPRYHARRLDAFTATAWRYLLAIAGLLVLGGVLDLAGAI